MSVLLATSLAGGLGAGARFVVDGTVNARRPTSFPLGSLVVNVVGSFLLGVVTGVWATSPDASWRLVLGTGFLGGFTTFSTAMLEAVRLLHAGRWVVGITLTLAMLGACLVAALGGHLLVELLGMP